jgi:RNA-directed DNA polymerase
MWSFDTLDHAHLREFLQIRVRDGVLKRLIGKWLKAGVLESGNIRYPDAGSPQGGVISPLLANVFLHYVLDTWFRREVQPRLRGRAHLIRYADDFVILFRHEEDARRAMEVLPKRFGKYGLTLHPDKTRLVPFRHPSCKTSDTKGDDNHRPGTFDLLGFTHYGGRTRRGGWAVTRQTASKRLSRAVRSIAEWCRTNRHLPVVEQHAKLSQKMRGHYAYYGITGNARALHWFLWAVSRAWRKWLNRRNRCRVMVWGRFNRLLKHYRLPPPKVVHTYVK